MASFASERASFTNFLGFSLNLVDDQYSDGKSDPDPRALSRSKVIYCAGSVYIYLYIYIYLYLYIFIYLTWMVRVPLSWLEALYYSIYRVARVTLKVWLLFLVGFSVPVLKSSGLGGGGDKRKTLRIS